MSKFRIESVETFCLPPRWIVVRVETADGYVGWGECGVLSWPNASRAAIAEVAAAIKSADVGGIRDVWEVASKARAYHGGAVLSGAVSAIDQALWDILGRRANMPVHVLLGGKVRTRVKAYSWLTLDEHGRERVRPEEFAALATVRVAQGFKALKLGTPRSGNKTPAYDPIETLERSDEIVEHVAAIRSAVGPDIDLAIDVHGRLTLPMAKRVLKLLEPFELLFVEEPTPSPHIETLRVLAAHTKIPLASGERSHSALEFKAMLDAGLGVLQTDLNNVGGLTEARRIADVARSYNAVIAPHCSAGPIGLAASLQFGFATPNFLIQEQGTEYYADRDVFPYDYFGYVKNAEALTPVDGYFQINDEPGLGIVVDDDAVRELALDAGTWAPPVLRRNDGSFAQW